MHELRLMKLQFVQVTPIIMSGSVV